MIDAFPLDVAGIDFLFSDRGLLFNEINLSPGWSGDAEAIVPALSSLIHAKVDKLVKKKSKIID